MAATLQDDDLLFLYYRDRALMQARGVTSLEMAREHLATAKSSSGGRQMPVHGSYRRLGIYPPATPTASQCLPAVGAAWGIKHKGESRVVLCTIGDASTRQGEFYEAVVQAVQDRLPIVFVVEDNGYGISTPTLDQLPFRLGIFDSTMFRHVDGRSVDAVATAGGEAIAAARRGDGPTILWVELDRLTSHTNSDDHRIYRSAAEIAQMKTRDPVTSYAASLVASGALDEAQVRTLQDEATVEADAAYAAAEVEPAPAAHSANTKLFGPFDSAGYLPPFALEDSANTMAGALNSTLREVLARIPNAVLLGEDVEDPKGGVFGFTKGLSTRFPGRVVNSALAEATIAGMGIGLGGDGFPAHPGNAVHRFHRAGVQSVAQPGGDIALALEWRLDLSGGVLRSLWRLPAGRKHLAQPVQRRLLDAHSGTACRGSKHAGRPRGPLVERNAGVRSHAAARPQAHHARAPRSGAAAGARVRSCAHRAIGNATSPS